MLNQEMPDVDADVAKFADEKLTADHRPTIVDVDESLMGA